VIVVTDTSVVLNLCLIGREALLPELFGKVIAPETVAASFSASPSRILGFTAWSSRSSSRRWFP